MSYPMFKPADILIPADIPTDRWCALACDQFTSQPEYWDMVSEAVGNSPSTYNMIFPECWLEDPDADSRVQRIHWAMDNYLAGGVFREIKSRYVYLERTLPSGAVRRGLIGAIDLEQYSYDPAADAPIRATEGTVDSRIPPRMAVRRNAALELPHVMLLMDDAEHTVIEPLAGAKAVMQPEYAGELMLGGGKIAGWSLPDELAEGVDAAVAALGEKFPMVFAVGDGNHSLASAKGCFEELKKTMPREQWENHPARYALVELVNLYDEGLTFEPIHRIVLGVDRNKLLSAMAEQLELSGICLHEGAQPLRMLCNSCERQMWFNTTSSPLVTGNLQEFLDRYFAENPGHVDYIHGDGELHSLFKKDPHSIGFLLPAMPKEELFPFVMANGVMPRKTFSMGLAREKRYYMECRRIK